MPAFLTNFGEFNTNETPPTFTQRWATGSSALVTEKAGSVGGKVLRMGASGDSSTYKRRAFSWNDVGILGDFEVISLFHPAFGSGGFGQTYALVLRGSGGEGSETGYYFGYDNGILSLARIVNGISNNLSNNVSGGIPSGALQYLKVNIEAGTIRIKRWTAASSEPGDWTLVVEDPSPLPDGWVGVGGRGANTAVDYDILGVEYSGILPSVSIDQEGPISLEIDETSLLTATVTGDPEPDLVWTSSDQDVVIVDEETGLVTAIGLGEATITATATNSDGFDSDDIVFKVVEAPEFATLWDTKRSHWVRDPGHTISVNTFTYPINNSPINPICEPVIGEASLQPAGANWRLQGGIHDFALLADTQLGAGKAFRAKSKVYICALGRYADYSFYHSSRSVQAGVGISGRGIGIIGQPPTWWGFVAVIHVGSPAMHTVPSLGMKKGYGTGTLLLNFLDHEDLNNGKPSEYGFAGRQLAFLTMPRMNTYSPLSNAYHDAGIQGGRWWCDHSNDIPLTSVCPSCGDSTQSVPVVYEVELEVTQHSPGTVRVRSRVSVVGSPGETELAEPNHEGWHIDTLYGGQGQLVGPIDLDCGWAGMAGRSYYDIQPFQGGYSNFVDFEAQVIDPGDCEATPVPEPWEPPEDPADDEPPAFPDPQLEIESSCDLQLLIYDDDGETVFTAIGSSPFHPNPALKNISGYSGQSIDFVEGSSIIDQVNLRIIDIRTDPRDQDSGWFTSILPDSGGESKLIGRRALLRRFIGGDGWKVLLDGNLTSIIFNETFVGYDIQVRDSRERERNSKARLNLLSNTSLLPLGNVSGYGEHPGIPGQWIHPPVDPVNAVFKVETFIVTTYRFDFDENQLFEVWPDRVPVSSPARAPLIGEPFVYDSDGSLLSYKWRNAVILWKPRGSSEDWRLIGDIVKLNTPPIPPPMLLDLIGVEPEGPTGPIEIYATGIPLPFQTSLSPIDIPEDNQEVEIIVLYIGDPSPVLPLYIDNMTLGELVSDVYEEIGQRHDGPSIREKLPEPIRAKLVEPPGEARSWLERMAFKPVGAASIQDDSGRMTVTRFYQPDPEEVDSFFEINNGMVKPYAEWVHGEDTAINLVSVVRFRDVIREVDGQEPFVEEVRVLDLHPAVHSYGILGERETSIDAGLFRAIEHADGTVDDPSAFLASERKNQLLTRYHFGAQTTGVMAKYEDTKHLRVGDVVRLNISWLPDYSTGRRGMKRVAQITSLGDPDCGWRSIVAEDVFTPTIS